ncbi:MAG: hypothetical protein GY851_11380, partial [bacterium]|nr:hypothetical protein [bacterium]
MRRWVALLLPLAVCLSAWAHVGEHPSVHDTVATVVDRMRSGADADELSRMDEKDVLAILTKDERHVLGTEHWSFHANVPVTVSVIRHTKQQEDLFWLMDQGFEKTDLAVTADGEPYEVWQKRFDRGPVGLGVNGFRVHREHYFVAVQPKKKRAKLELTKMYPGRHRTTTFKVGARPYVDEAQIKV